MGGEPHMPDDNGTNTSMLTTFSLMNIRGLVPRTVPSTVSYIMDFLNESSQLAFALTETWLSDRNPAELHIPGHSLYRQDRARPRSKRGRDSGRVALYIRDDQAIFSEVVFIYSNGVTEAIGLQLKSLNLLLVVLYRQPDNRECNRRSTSREFGHFPGELEEFLASQSPPAPDLLNESSQLAFALTETGLSDHNPAELHISGYSLYRQDRARPRSKRGRDSGGVALYIRDDQAIFNEVVFTYSNGVIETIGLQLQSLNFLLVVLYQKPDNRECNRRSTSREFGHFLGELEEFLASQSPPAPDTVIMGGFNLPHGDWSGGESTQGATGDEGDMVRASNELTSSHFLVQQVECSTHKDGGMLDLIFTNNGDLIHNFSVLPSPKSDHFLIEISAVYKEPSVSEVEHSSMTDVVDGEDPDFGDLNFFSEKIDSNALKMELYGVLRFPRPQFFLYDGQIPFDLSFCSKRICPLEGNLAQA